jgi:prolyl-tRNA synthetase
MRLSVLFGRTLRETPADTELPSHQLLLRGGYIRQLSAGIYSLLPLGARVAARIEQILREEMDAVDGQEIVMPVVQPAELWQESGRWHAIGPELARFKDRAERDMVLAMTHEEVVADLARAEIRSYRQLPAVVYQLQTKFRDEPRARGGLIRTREFTMKDAYSLHTDFADLDAYYPRMHLAYERIFQRCGLDFVSVAADTGMMGGTEAHEFMALSPYGEDTLVLCDGGGSAASCGYSANQQVATFRKPEPETAEMLPMEPVPTPNTATIADLAKLLQIPESRTAKAVFRYSADEQKLIFAVVRGDMEVSDTKLSNAAKAGALRPATPEEIAAAGAVAGYASPVGIRNALVIVDDAIPNSRNLVAGANREGEHLRNVNYGRDYTAQTIADIAEASEGASCSKCGAPLRLTRGIEVGNIFKLGTKYSDSMGVTFLDAEGQQRPVVMGCYGIGVGRLMAAVIEQSHDEKGILWPISLAPYPVHVVALTIENDEVREAAEALVRDLAAAGIPAIYDDRADSAGVKFNDADLMGMPLRLTVSPRGLKEDAIELKLRRDASPERISRETVVAVVQERLEALRGELPGPPKTDLQ